MFTEKNTGTNLPAQIEIYATPGNEYSFLFIAKGGGSANKTFLYQQTKALLNEKTLYEFINEKMKTLGTSACPPYHLAVVIGGTSAEFNLKMVKYASTKYLDHLPTSGESLVIIYYLGNVFRTVASDLNQINDAVLLSLLFFCSGNEHGRAFRDLEAESRVLRMSQELGIGAQFGGKYFCHDVRVIRLPRHGASCPVGIGVSCSADRQVREVLCLLSLSFSHFCHNC